MANEDPRIFRAMDAFLYERGYLPPVENVSVRLRIPAGRRVRRLAGFPETSFRHKQSGQELELRFPRIDAYQGVTFELQ